MRAFQSRQTNQAARPASSPSIRTPGFQTSASVKHATCISGRESFPRSAAAWAGRGRVGASFQSQGGSRGSIRNAQPGLRGQPGQPTPKKTPPKHVILSALTAAASGVERVGGWGGCPFLPDGGWRLGLFIAKNFCGSILADCFVLTPHNNQLRHCQRNTHRRHRPSPSFAVLRRPSPSHSTVHDGDLRNN